MLSKNEMNTTFMELAPLFLQFLDGEKEKIDKEIARLKATEQREAKATNEPTPATAVADADEATQVTDDAETAEEPALDVLVNEQETTTTKRRSLSGLRRRQS